MIGETMGKMTMVEVETENPKHHAQNSVDTAGTVSMLGLIGLLVGLGQLLASDEVLTWRIVVGRALSSAGLGASAAAVLTWMPDLPLAAQFGIAALIASLGTSGLEKLVQRIFGPKS